MFELADSKKIQGNMGMASAINYYSFKGHVVSIPLTDSQSYDLIIESENILFKIQVKTTSYKHNIKKKFAVQIRQMGHKKSNGERSSKPANLLNFDFLYILTSDKEIYIIPKDELESYFVITLGKKYDKYKVNF